MATSKAPKSQAPLSLSSLVEQARVTAIADTFNVADVETRVAQRTGNVGMRVTCASGKVITFWSSNMDQVVKVLDEDKGLYGIVPGTQMSFDKDDEVYSLIPAGSSSGGFWKR